MHATRQQLDPVSVHFLFAVTKSIYSVMVQSIDVEKAWWQELDLAGYNGIHSVRKQRDMNIDTSSFSSLYAFQGPSPCNGVDHS